MKNKFYLKAPIEIQKETESRKEKASEVIKLPKEGEKQPDLLYFSAIFVSSGENLNHAFFLPSELVAAEGTIINKALDIEHKEDEIIGHIYERAYMDKDGNSLELSELSSRETATLNEQEMHVAIAGIIYKNRFPNLAKEVSDGDWFVSMECYYQDFDVKVGDLILNRKEADALGLASEDDSIFGKIAKVLKNGAEIAAGQLTRVLRGVAFSGCGVVKNPANPPSVILETAKEKKRETDAEIVLDYDSLEKEDVAVIKDNNVTSEEIEASKSGDDGAEEESALQYDDTIGICVNYKRRVLDKANTVVGEDMCSLFNTKCTSFSRDTSDPKCLRNRAHSVAASMTKELLKRKEACDRRGELVKGLKAALNEAVKTLS